MTCTRIVMAQEALHVICPAMLNLFLFILCSCAVMLLSSR